MSKKAKVILILCVLLGIGGYTKIQEHKAALREVLGSAVYVTDVDRLDESLAGKYVILAGTPVLSEGAYDTELAISFDSPVVRRESRVLYDHGTAGKQQMSWDIFYKSDRNPVGSTTFYGTAKIGAYTVTGSALNYMFGLKTTDVVTRELAEQTGWVYWENYRFSDHFLLSRALTFENDYKNYLDEGTIRLSYHAKGTEGLPCTVFGYYENGCLRPTEEWDTLCQTELLSKEEFIAKY